MLGADFFIASLSLIIVISVGISLIFKHLRQSLVLAYILTGVFISKYFIKVLEYKEILQIFSELGVSLLLFSVGAEIELERLKDVIKTSGFIGFLQIAITFLLSLLAFIFFGFSFSQAFLFATIASISSTMIVMKLYNDLKKANSVPGRLSLAILLVQDIFIILILPIFASKTLSIEGVLSAISRILFLVFIGFIVERHIFSKLFRKSTGDEMFFLISLASCFAFMALSYSLGISPAVGALLAGLIIANFPFHYEIIGRVRGLRDFFSMIFFITIGMQVYLPKTFDFSFFFLFFFLIFILKPIIVYFLARFFKYDRKSSFLTAISLSQTSEFSLILLQYASSSNLLSQDYIALTVFLFAILAATTPIIMNYNKELFSFFDKHFVKLFKEEKKEKKRKKVFKNHIVIFGAGRIGMSVLEYIRKNLPEYKVVVVDQDPDVVFSLLEKDIYAICGDATTIEILENISLDKAKLVMITVPSFEENIQLVRYLKNKKPIVFARAHNRKNAKKLYEEGADFVIFPEMLAINEIIRELEVFLEKRKSSKALEDFYYRLMDEQVI